MGNHVCGVDPGKRLVVGILENARTAHGKGAVHHLCQCKQIVAHPFGKPPFEESGEYLFVGGVAKGQRVQVVVGHELVENIGAEHYGARYGDGDAVEIVALGMFLDYRVDERQAASFSSEGALSDTGEIGIVVEPVFPELGHHAAVLHLAVFDDEIEEQPFHGGRFLNGVEPVPFYDIGDREHGAGVEPARNVVAAGMVEERCRRDVVHALLQFVDRRHAHYLLPGLRVEEMEIAEPEAFHYGLTKIHREFLGGLVKEHAVETAYAVTVFAFGGLHDNGQVGIARAHELREFQTGMGIFHPLAHETYVGYDAEHLV